MKEVKRVISLIPSSFKKIGLFNSLSFFIVIIMVFIIFFKLIYDYTFLSQDFLYLNEIIPIIFSIAGIMLIFIFLVAQVRVYEFLDKKGSFGKEEIERKNKESNFIKSKEYFKGTYTTRDFSEFLFFIFYFGTVVMVRFFWTLNKIILITIVSIKNKINGFNTAYMLRKIWDAKRKEYLYQVATLALNKVK